MPTFPEKHRHFTAKLVVGLLCASLSTACSGQSDGSSVPPVNGEDGFRTLVSVDWELAPGSEEYWCAWVTVTEDMYVGAFRSINPPGTHHTALTVADQALVPDGVRPCSVATVGRRTIFGSGVGTQPLESPPGLAIKLSAGNQLILNLHLFNTSQETLRGTSGSRAKTIDESAVQELWEGIAAGPFVISVPPGRSTQTGKCTFDHDSTIFRIIPHMHQTGVHMKVVAHSSLTGPVVLHDAAYDFYEQLVYPIDNVPMKTGDVLDIACTYENHTGRTLTFGESSLDEMCIAGIGRFPARDGSSVCAQ